MSVSPLNRVFLQMVPAPRSIAESRCVYQALKKFGEIEMFKIPRHDLTTKALTPRAHLIYKSTSSGASLLAASPLKIPDTRITLSAFESTFPHEQQIGRVWNSRAVRISGVLSLGKLVVGDAKADKESGGDDGEEVVSGNADIKGDVAGRLLKRFSGGFTGFDGVEGKGEGMAQVQRDGGSNTVKS